MAKAKLTLKQEADMLSAVNQIKELEAAGKQLKKQADELRSQVKAMMDKKHLEEMDVGNFTVRYTTVVSSRFQQRLLHLFSLLEFFPFFETASMPELHRHHVV